MMYRCCGARVPDGHRDGCGRVEPSPVPVTTKVVRTMEECPRCFALVAVGNIDKHIDWHQYVRDEFHAYRENPNWPGQCDRLARGNYGDGMYCGLPPEHHHHQPLPEVAS